MTTPIVGSRHRPRPRSFPLGPAWVRRRRHDGPLPLQEPVAPRDGRQPGYIVADYIVADYIVG